MFKKPDNFLTFLKNQNCLPNPTTNFETTNPEVARFFFNVFHLTHHVSLIHLNLYLDNLFWLDPDPWYAANVWV